VGLARDIARTLNTLVHASSAAAASTTDGATAKQVQERRVTQQKLATDAREAVKRFTEVAQAAGKAEARNPLPPTAGGAAGGSGGGGGRGGPGGGREGKEDAAILARLQEVDLSAALIDERDAAIDSIAVSVSEVNDVFKDIAMLVEEQGKTLERVDVNVGQAKDRTEAGVGHLTEASKLQGKYRRCLLILLAVVILIAGGVTAYFIITAKRDGKL
jgi:hypothetical protein